MIVIPVNRVPIHIHRPGHALAFDPSTPDIERRLGGFRRIQSRVRQIRRVVDHDHQHAPWTASFKPIVVTPIHLRHRAQAGPPLAPFAMAISSSASFPESTFFQQRGQRVRAQLQALFCQLLAGEGGAEIRVLLLMSFHGPLLHILAQSSIAQSPTQLVQQACISFQFESFPDPPRLPQRNPHQLRRFNNRQLSSLDSTQRIQPNSIIP
jgi:hypothetical protein